MYTVKLPSDSAQKNQTYYERQLAASLKHVLEQI